jgi:hypothetical protein
MCFLILAMALTQDAWARPSALVVREAERRFQLGNDLYHRGQYLQAMQAYQASFDLYPSAQCMFNLALSKEKVLDYEGCALAFRQYLEESQNPAGVGKARAGLERCLAHVTVPVKVSSMPPSAAITVGDGASAAMRGRTPARLDLAPGSYRITASMPGYLPETQEVSVELGRSPEIDFLLQKLSSLRVETDVSGAAVSIDGGPLEVAPVQRELVAGVYRVRVEKAGYHAMNREVRVEAGQQMSLVLTLQPLPKVRVLAVEANTPGTIRIDGEEKGALSTARKLLSGAHRVELYAPGHLPLVQDLRIPEDRDVRLRVHLEPLRTPRQRVVLWSLFGAACAAAATGGVYGALALTDSQEFNGGVPSVMLAEQGTSRAETADVMLGSALALGATAAIYYFATQPGSSHADLR